MEDAETGEGEGEGWRVVDREVSPPTLPPFEGGMMEGGRVAGRISPAWQSWMSLIACV